MVDIEPRLFRALRFTKGLNSIGYRQLMNEQEKCLSCDLMIVMKKGKKGNEKFFHTLEEKINHPNHKKQINHHSVNLI